MSARRALIIGIAGQDGSFLAELLLAEGYEVFGVVRQPVSTPFENIESIRRDVELTQANVLDELSLMDVLAARRPHEVYNLASPSFVPMSWQQPVLTAEFAAVGCTALLEAIRRVDDSIRFYQASSSEIFGEPREVPQTEETPLRPVTPYGVAKAYAHFITLSYRRRYGLHASSGRRLGLVLFRWDAPLFFANAELFQERVLEAADKSPTPVRWLVVAAEPVTSVDITAADILAELDDTLREAGIELCFAELKDPVKDKLKRFGLFAQLGELAFFPTLGAAVGAYLKAHQVDWVDWEVEGS